MNVAFIPVRGGSKSIPFKNIKPICGKPLVYWTIKAACNCKYIQKVYIATDSDKIREVVETFKDDFDSDKFSKLEIIGRSSESASDFASTEFAMLEFANKYNFDNIVLIQATSPLLQSSDLDQGFEAFNEEGVDSVISVVRQKRFHWANDKQGYAYSTNYDIYNRPRRQDFEGYLVENGAYYISSKKNLIKSQNRISGNIKTVEMSEDTFFEIDEPSDWNIIETLMKKRSSSICLKKPEIKMFLTDCDGCLTDGGMYYSENGDELKKFNTKDGMGFAILKQKGILTGIITGENVELNKRRAKKMQLDILKIGCIDKLKVIKELCDERKISLDNVCYIGDDIYDLEAIRNVGLGCCPADAIPEIKGEADFITNSKGGEGVIREVINYLYE
jgi:N-acylneuraminate cytidylyltransferase